MLSLVLLLLIKNVLIPRVLCDNGQEVIDLSVIYFFANQEFEKEFIHLRSHPDIKQLKIKNCNNCSHSDKLSIKCGQVEMIQVVVDLKKGDYSMSVPFNRTCSSNVEQKMLSITQFKTFPEVNNISLSWKMESSENIKHFLIYCISSNQHVREIMEPSKSSHSFINLKEKSWYRICIAIVDMILQTTLYSCHLTLTDFSITGPVTKITTESESDRIKLSWNKPLYQYDYPNSYIINVTGPSNMCRSYVIEMTGSVSTADNLCQDQRRINWDNLQSLEIDNLSPYSNYHVKIFPINRKKKYTIETLSIKTKEGESDAVQKLNAIISSKEFIYLVFLEPSNPNGIITKYLVKIIHTQSNICTKTNITTLETFLTRPYEYISTNKLTKCGLFDFEVTPINGWDHNGGRGKSASKVLEYDTGQPSFIWIEVQFLSSNLMIVHLSNIRSDDNCETVALVLETYSINNSSHCIVTVITNNYCPVLKHAILSKFECPNIKKRKWSRKSSTLEVPVIGIFFRDNYYQTKVWSVDNKMWSLNSSSVMRNTITDCFTNCNGNGIRSAAKDGEQCSEINFCTGCISIDHLNNSVDSVTIQWSAPSYSSRIIGYLALLHNTDTTCDQYHIQLCDQCEWQSNLTITVKNLYMSCKTGDFYQSISMKTQFNGLHQNKQYIVYIIPIIDRSNVGEVRNISVKTLLSKPMTLQNVVVKSRSHHHIKLSWDKQTDFTSYGEPDHYTIQYRESHSGIKRELKSKMESVMITNLSICSLYCLSVRSDNKAGSSDFSKEICSHTLATKPAMVEMQNPVDEYSKNRIISWKDLNENNCKRLYELEYSIKYVGKPMSTRTNETSIKLITLKTNVIYMVRARIINQIDTINNETFGEYSDYKEFYTGQMNLYFLFYRQNIDFINKTIHVSWELYEEIQGSLFEFIITFRNSNYICTQSVHLICSNCEDPWKSDNVDGKIRNQIKTLLNCTQSNKVKYEKERVSFKQEFRSKNVSTNFSIEIYGVNLKGIHSLSKKTEKPLLYISNSWITFLILAILGFLFFFLVVFFFYKRSIMNKNQSPKINENIQQISQDISMQDILTKSTAIPLSKFNEYYNQDFRCNYSEIRKEYQKLKSRPETLDTLSVTRKNKNLIRKIRISSNTYEEIKISEKKDFDARYIPFVGNESQIEYIVSQNPDETSFLNFWNMIWENNINCIIMLSKREQNGSNCAQYWPKYIDKTVFYGSQNEYSVTLSESKDHESHLERLLYLSKTFQQKHVENAKKIYQLQMHLWNDQLVPRFEFLDNCLLRFYQLSKEDTHYPILVHCSTGVEATGLYICIDRIVKNLMNGFREINIYDSVLNLKINRDLMVQTEEDYIFLYKYINHYLNNFLESDEIKEIYTNERKESEF